MRLSGRNVRARARALLLLLVVACSLAYACAAAAETPSKASIAADMRDYYAAEKHIAFVFVAIGATSMAAGGALVYRGSDFAKGVGGSLLTLGTLQALGAGFYAFQVDAQAAHFGALLASDPAAYQREELAHVHGTTSRFVLYRLSELALALAGAGVATYGFASSRDAWKGIGVGVAAQATLFLVIDSFGASRAHAYEDTVRSFTPTVSLAPDLRGASAGLSARF